MDSQPSNTPWITPRPLRNNGESRKIIRAAGTLHLAEADPLAVHAALGQTAGLIPEEHAAITLEIDSQKNILVATTPCQTAIPKLLAMSALHVNNEAHLVHAYAPAERGTCRGVIHNVRPGTSPEELMKLLAPSPNYTILQARMMGRTHTAIVTFDGTYIPHNVNLGGVIFRCRPHKPKAQQCSKCLGLGHRADICTRSTTSRCSHCGHPEKDEAHDCRLRCVNCQGPHRADDPSCPARLSSTQRYNYRPTARESTLEGK